MSITVEIDTTSTATTAASLRRLVAMAKAASLAVDATKTNAPDMTRGVDRRNTMVQAHTSNGSNGKSKHDFGPLFGVAPPVVQPATPPVAMVTTRTLTATVMQITPEKAKELLTRNYDRNRKPRRARIDRYRREMEAGRWYLSHQGIAFDVQWRLIDGQHRLIALSESNVPYVEMLVFHYQDATPMTAIDTGGSRSSRDLLVLSGLATREESIRAAAAAQAIIQATRRSTSNADHETIASVYREFKAEIDWAISQAGPGWIAPLNAAMAYAYPCFPEVVAMVAEKARTAVDLRQNSPEHALHTFISAGLRAKGGDRSANNTVFRTDVMYKTLSLLAAACTNKQTVIRVQAPRATDGIPQALSFFAAKRRELNLPTGLKG